MGNHKFRLSDMIPRAWLRKLKPPGSTLTNPKDASDDMSSLDEPLQRKSYHFSRQFDTVHPPRRSTNKHRRSPLLRRPTRRYTPRRVTTSVSSGCSCRALVRDKPECRFPISPSSSLSSTDAVFRLSPPSFGHSSGSVPSTESFDQLVSWTTSSSSCRCKADVETLEEGFDRDPLFEFELERKLPAVITKPPEFNEMVMNLRRQEENKKPPNSTSTVSVKVVNKEQKKPRMIANSAGSPAGGMRLRVNSPKLATRKHNQARLQGRKSTSIAGTFRPGRNGVSNGLAVVKSSVDPGKDFKESMVEMIMENDIRGSKDLEELLACYLMLNSEEYHDLIVGVFKEIWFDFYGAVLK